MSEKAGKVQFRLSILIFSDERVACRTGQQVNVHFYVKAVYCLLFTVSSEHCKSLLTCSAPPIIFFVHSHYPVPGI